MVCGWSNVAIASNNKQIEYYYNTLTGEHHTIQVTNELYPSGNVMRAVSVTYPDGTERPEEMLEKNGSSWWLDDYYTK